MSTIHTLPPTTAKLLTATQTITTPLSIVKELLDNSLDARATSISIEISANTLDVLQVRDNGHGIGPEDRGLCCRRHTTSKLGRIEELGSVGGRSLGFRGEALFAVRQVAAGMEVVTRVDGEAVAVKMTIGREGEVVSRRVACAGTGTTVRITDIFSSLPVRKQTAEKDASKCLTQFKKLLQSYAVARPHVRLSLRVLKAKNDKSNFSYAPKAGEDASVHDAAWKVVGSESASQCEWFVLQTGQHELQALLPTSDANAKAISNIGHFISIDQRPVSSTRGTLHQVSKLISGRLRGSNLNLANIRDPFFAVNIACPEGSYDPNVEPAKDDVLFHDADGVVKAVNELLSAAYPKLAQEHEVLERTPESGSEDELNSTARFAEKEDLFSTQLLDEFIEDIEDDDLVEVEPTGANPKQQKALQTINSARTNRAISSNSKGDENMLVEPLANTNELEVLDSRANTWRPTMYGFDEEEVDLFAEHDHEEADEAAELQQVDQRDINPWTIARMRAGRQTQQPREPIREVSEPRPRARSLSPGLDRPRHAERNDGLSTPMYRDDMQAVQSPAHQRARPGLLQLTTQVNSANQMPTQSKSRGGLPTPHPSSSPPHEPPYEHPAQPSWNQRQRKANKAPNQAFKPPMRQRHSNNGGDDFEPIRPPKRTQRKADGRRDFAQMLRSNVQNQALGPMGEPEEIFPSNTDLENEFRARLRQAGEDLDTQYSHRVMARHDESDGGQALTTSRRGWTPINSAPQHAHDLQPEGTATPPLPASKRRRTTEGKRTKSPRWPLERVPDGAELHDLVQRILLNSTRLESFMFHFADALTRDVDYDTAASNVHDADLVKELEDKQLSDMSIRAVTLLGQRLRVAERMSNEHLRLAYVGTLVRLERMADVED